MQRLWRRLEWRPVFLSGMLFGAPLLGWFGRPGVDRTDAARWTLVGVWLAVALLYAMLAWRTRASSRELRGLDLWLVAVLAGTALFEANWPGRVPNVTPERVALVAAASALAGYLVWARRKRRTEVHAAAGT